MHLNAYKLRHTIHFELKLYILTQKQNHINRKTTQWKSSHCGESDLKATFCWYLISKFDVEILINTSQKYNQQNNFTKLHVYKKCKRVYTLCHSYNKNIIVLSERK